MRSTETEIAVIQEKLKELDELSTAFSEFKIRYALDKQNIQDLLRLVASLKKLLMVLATTLIGSVATALFNRYN
jgi:hypothetical protein